VGGEGPCQKSRHWTAAIPELPGVIEDGMPGKNAQRKLGTTRRRPRSERSDTAKASHITCHAGKLGRACEWGAWGRLSVDGSGQNNPSWSEGPWGKAAGPLERRCPTEQVPPTPIGDHTLPRRARRATANRARMRTGRHCWKGRPLSRTAENAPYGISGGAMETSASSKPEPRHRPTRLRDEGGGHRKRAEARIEAPAQSR
jgi:hypothetical protein